MITDGQKKAVARVRERRKEEISAPRIDGRIPRARFGGRSRSRDEMVSSRRTIQRRPKWNDRFSFEDSTTGTATVRRETTSRSRFSNTSGSSRLQTTRVVERADGDFVTSFDRKVIICTEKMPGPSLTSTGISPMKMALLDACNSASAQRPTSTHGQPAAVPDMEILRKLENYLLELETAGDLIKRSLGDLENENEEEKVTVDAVIGPEDKDDKASSPEPAEPLAVLTSTNEVVTSSIHPTYIDISLDQNIEEKFYRHAQAYKYRRRRIEEPLTRSGLSAAKVFEM